MRLIGRQQHLSVIGVALDQIRDGGRALLFRGPPGIGKSALLAAAHQEALRRSIRVVSTTGSEQETGLLYGALVSMIRPWQHMIDTLVPAQRDALRATIRDLDRTPSPTLIALAVLELMSEVAADHGLVIIIDDVHWLDPMSRDALGFLTRRVTDEPIVALMAARSNHPRPTALAGEEVAVGPLRPPDAEALIDSYDGADLTRSRRRRILDLAQGNPLALIELSRTEQPDPAYVEPADPVLNDRLERVFADRFADLPQTCRGVLITAAANEAGTLAETVAAASVVTSTVVAVEDLAPAVDADLITINGTGLRFRHPLVRSAIWQAAPDSTRRRVHGALAALLVDDPLRRAVHLAAAAIGADETVAGEVARASALARRQGSAAVALSLAETAARLTVDPQTRSDRLLEAAALAVEVGRADVSTTLVDELHRVRMTAAQRASLTWIEELREDRIRLEPEVVRELLDVARSCRDRGDLDLARRLLRSAAHRCWWSPENHHDLAVRVWEQTVDLPGGDRDSPFMMFVRICVQSDHEGDAVRARLRSQLASDTEATTPPEIVHLLGQTAQFAGDPQTAVRLLTRAGRRYREHSQLGPLAQALTSTSVGAVLIGQFRQAAEAAEEALRLGHDVASRRWETAAQLSSAAGRACLDPRASVDHWPTETLERLGSPAQWAQYAHVRGLIAESADDHPEAYRQLQRIFTPSDPCHHPTYGSWVIADLVDAGVRSGHGDQVAPLVAELESWPQPSPMLVAGLAFARAVLTAPADRESRFVAALAEPALLELAFLRARTQLELGGWLRRHRRRSEARDQLRLAWQTFDDLGVIRWADRARSELTAAGEANRHPVLRPLSELTAQEMAIARLAAQGLSNREIGTQLFLSHRTVGSHLYRIFPKLGISGRTQLARLLPESGVLS